MSAQQDTSSNPEGIGRRRFIGLTLVASLLATIGGVLAPIIAYLWPPEQAEATSNLKVQVGTVDEFPANSGKVVSVANKPVIVLNSEKGGLRAFSAVCTHLGCIVYWHEQRQIIQCPCHDGRFNPVNGQVLLGPPPAPLAEYRLQVEGDAVYVQSGGGA
jgi:cytochrome b6-f complex iron-sulfur subunit